MLAGTALAARRGAGRHASTAAAADWAALRRAGHALNPCKSPHHPAAIAGVAPSDGGDVLSVQEAYDAESLDFVCGPSNPRGLRMRSFRTSDGGVESTVVIGEEFQTLPGLVSPGVVSAVLEGHGSWASAVALMDRSILPRPPLMLSTSFSVQVLDRLSPGTPAVVRSVVRSINDHQEPFLVHLEAQLLAREPDRETTIAVMDGSFEKIGAIRGGL